MALEGFLQEFGLADILQLVYFQRKTGVLYIEGKTDKVELSFIEGNITNLKSQRRVESGRLGKMLVRKGLITHQDLENVMEVQRKENVKLGNIVARKNLVSKDALVETIQEQIIESIVQIFAWQEGRYEFDPRDVPVDQELPVSLDTQHLLMDGLRIVDEWSLVEGKLDLNTVYRTLREPEPEELNDLEKETLGLVDGESDVSTIVENSYSGDYETSKALISLEEKGIIEAVLLKPIEKQTVDVSEERSYLFYAAVFGVFVIILVSLFKGGFDALGGFREAGSGFTIERIRNEVDVYRARNGQYPQSLEIITREPDVWGRPYEYSVREKGFLLFSRGPDGVSGTEDDVY